MLKRQSRIRLLFSLAIGFVFATVQAVVIKDDRQMDVVIAKTPQRIVSLLPSLTETVCALGQCKKLVGVDRYSSWPESVNKLPRMGGGIDPSIESCLLYTSDAADE